MMMMMPTPAEIELTGMQKVIARFQAKPEAMRLVDAMARDALREGPRFLDSDRIARVAEEIGERGVFVAYMFGRRRAELRREADHAG